MCSMIMPRAWHMGAQNTCQALSQLQFGAPWSSFPAIPAGRWPWSISLSPGWRRGAGSCGLSGGSRGPSVGEPGRGERGGREDLVKGCRHYPGVSHCSWGGNNTPYSILPAGLALRSGKSTWVSGGTEAAENSPLKVVRL